MTRTWTALLTVHAAWSIHLLVSYFLAWVGCAGDDVWLLALRHLATAVAAGAVVAAIWWEVPVLRSDPDRRGSSADRPAALIEPAHLARVTVTLGVIYLLAIVMTGASNLFLAPCA